MSQAEVYKRHRFPPEIMQYAVWLYHRFNLSHRDVEYLMAEQGVTLSYKAFAFGATSSGRNMLGG